MKNSPSISQSLPMTTPQSTALQGQHKQACSLCARRKIKCDKSEPCSNCTKAHAQCQYEGPAPPRPRKRAADEELLARLASYEDLMRKHKVDFVPYSHGWITSGPQGQIKQDDSRTTTSAGSSLNHQGSTSQVLKDIPMATERCLWSTLPTELMYPPTQFLARREDPLHVPTPSLHVLMTGVQPELSQLHPDPRHIYRFWQIFVESVNPLLKIVHVPTLQQQVLDASWNPAGASKPLTATLFAIYSLAVTSTSIDDCQATFGEARSTLMLRYRTAALRALIEADFLMTRDFDVLQALALFLFSDPDSELTSTLTGAAIRIGQKMGLNRPKPDPKISVFETEMRIRLWWQLTGLDCRVRVVKVAGMRLLPSEIEFGDIRLPLNVNDADLHPEMTELPAEQSGPTEMLYVLMKFETYNIIRSSATAVTVYDVIIHGPGKDKPPSKREDDAIDEIEAIYHEKFIRHLDRNIPLHALVYTMTKLTLARFRCKVHSPRGRANSNGEVLMTREEGNQVFDCSVTWLEMMEIAIGSKFSSYFIAHMTTKFTVDVYIYIISDLRKRVSGERVNLAWKLVGSLYEDHPELIENTQSSFFVALGDLTLEAWEARRRESVNVQGSLDGDSSPRYSSPRYIQLLRDQRQQKAAPAPQVPASDLHTLDPLALTDSANLDWDYWNDFLRL
ncbi:fungal specific transcription factor [Colletotrichum orchidophilum]|uniref:Fungal specific transcription factor n=1 Tax=Colletotrichum orchidophilum TaxID=1209926 RepID=A0A1G4BR11_9PEZI|nr:fungal specific transcription factor [Colletotrichum orchidophilum]OHF03889.1 fungal specific transcription factor [Colletotrichum orchidophilum]